MSFHKYFTMDSMAMLNKVIAYYIEQLPTVLINCKSSEINQEWFKKHNFYHWKVAEFNSWHDIDIHCVKQTWGSTAKGWGGIGGSAITSGYTVAIYNRYYKMITVFWDGRLAYIIEADENTLLHFREGKLPGYTNLDKFSLSLIYKPE